MDTFWLLLLNFDDKKQWNILKSDASCVHHIGFNLCFLYIYNLLNYIDFIFIGYVIWDKYQDWM